MQQIEIASADHPAFSDVKREIVDKFFTFHGENPKAWELFKRFANEARVAGRKRFGAQAIIERIRWYTSIETKGDDFKMNNDYGSCYTRLLIIEDPRFADLFETRQTPGSMRGH